MKRLKTILVVLLVLPLVFPTFSTLTVEAEVRMIVVPEDYSTIQEAIDNAAEGDTVYLLNVTR